MIKWIANITIITILSSALLNSANAQSLMDTARNDAQAQLTQNYPTIQPLASPTEINTAIMNQEHSNNNNQKPKQVSNPWLKPNPWAPSKTTHDAKQTLNDTATPGNGNTNSVTNANNPFTVTSTPSTTENANIYVNPSNNNPSTSPYR